MFGYFRDGVNPRGAEYGATARAARAAEQAAENTGDILAFLPGILHFSPIRIGVKTTYNRLTKLWKRLCAGKKKIRHPGLEPGTYALEVRCAIHLRQCLKAFRSLHIRRSKFHNRLLLA